MKTRKMILQASVILIILISISVGTALAATLCVNTSGTGGCFSSIQAAINAAAPGDTLFIKEGIYTENVVVKKPLQLMGEDEEETIIRPAVSNPNPCTGSSLCGGSASNIILVQADNVTIQNLTLDGDNPHLTSGIVRGGADLDARNGIITNHLLGTTFNNLVVHHVTVKNIYLRGIYASSGGTFNFHDNTIKNVQGEYASICMFNFGGSGVMTHNEASDCNDALSSNWSGGVQFLHNEITRSGSGIHTDNAGGFGVGSSDLIEGNKIYNSQAGGYGIFVFVPYIPVIVRGNTITNVDVGLSAFGKAAGYNPTTTFANNVVNGKKKSGSTGVYVTTDQLGYGQGDVSVSFVGNMITKNTDGFVVQSISGATLTLNGSCNAVLRNSNSGMTSSGNGISNVSINSSNFNGNTTGIKNEISTAVHAEKNWWGCSAGPGSPGCDKVVGNVSVTPILSQPAQCAPNGLGDDDEKDK